MKSVLTRLTTLAAVPVVTLATAVLGATTAQAATAHVVVAEAYGGGGNTGAPYRNDYIELFNPTDVQVDLSGWSVRYWSSTGTTYQSTPLSGLVKAGGTYLIQEAAGSNTAATALPTPDATGTIPMSASGARVALVDSSGSVVDLVGWGSTAATFEGSPAEGTSNTTSIARRSSCVDTDNNAADFLAGAPTPTNSSAAALTCAVTPPPVDPPETVAQIQGASHISPLKGLLVNGVAGIVTATTSTGFYLQSATPDSDPATSEGVFVFTRTAPSVAVGDVVEVAGTVTEFRPGGASGNDNLTTTEITGPRVSLLASGQALPDPVIIGRDRVAPAQTVEAGDPKSVEYAGALFRPDTDAIDFYESMEGMRVGLNEPTAVGPTASFGEIPVVPSGPISALRTVFGGVVYGSYESPNAMRVQLDDALIGAGNMPEVKVGDRLSGTVIGVVDYSFSNFKLEVTHVPAVIDGGATRESTTAQTNNELAVATFNVENLAPSDPQSKYDRLAGQIVHNLAAPDVIALEEIQDNSGSQNNGTVDSSTTSTKLIDAIVANGGPRYEARWINPVDGMDGGQPGGNIRQVFLFRPDRDVEFVDTPGGDAVTATGVTGTGKGTHLTASPGRIDPTDAAFTSSRKPLVGEFQFRGQTIFVIANHFNSKGGDDPLFGRWQQPVRGSEPQRHAQAQLVRGFVDELMQHDPAAKVVVAGDINDFEFSETANILVGDGSLIDLPRTVAPSERWTYVYEGNSQVLDHILISKSLTIRQPGTQGPAFAYDIVHTNAAFPDQDSDHDPQVVRLALRGGN